MIIDAITNARAAKAEKHLATFVCYEDRLMTRKDMIHCCIRDGMLPETQMVPCIKDMSRQAMKRATLDEEYEHKKRQRDSGYKTEYRMYNKSNMEFVCITKTQYEYANTILNK